MEALCTASEPKMKQLQVMFHYARDPKTEEGQVGVLLWGLACSAPESSY